MISELRLDKFAKHQLVLQLYPINHYFSITNKSLVARRVLNLVLPTPNDPTSLWFFHFMKPEHVTSYPPLAGCRVEKDGSLLHLCIGRNELIAKHLKRGKRQVVSQCLFIQLVFIYFFAAKEFTPRRYNIYSSTKKMFSWFHIHKTP